MKAMLKISIQQIKNKNTRVWWAHTQKMKTLNKVSVTFSWWSLSCYALYRMMREYTFYWKFESHRITLYYWNNGPFWYVRVDANIITTNGKNQSQILAKIMQSVYFFLSSVHYCIHWRIPMREWEHGWSREREGERERARESEKESQTGRLTKSETEGEKITMWKNELRWYSEREKERLIAKEGLKAIKKNGGEWDSESEWNAVEFDWVWPHMKRQI